MRGAAIFGVLLLAACAGSTDPGPAAQGWDSGRDGSRDAGGEGRLATDTPDTPDTLATRDPIDLLPVARYTSPASVDDLARCIGERWAGLSVFAPGKVTLHPGWRGLVVDVRTARDPLARAYVEIYPAAGVTQADYFVRSFVSDPDEDLRRRALLGCF